MKKAGKILAVTVSFIMLIMAFALPSFAADLSKDGSYSVPVTLYHASKDKVSMGNKYITQTALITVENGKKYITVVADGVDDLTFSYYLDGSTEGETAKATEVKNVDIDGTTYSIGYKFPLVTDNSDVGVTFKAPVMPVSPSARLRIDYSKLKALDTEEETTEETAEETEAVSETDIQDSEEASEVTEEEQNTEEASSAVTEETAVTEEETAETEDDAESASPVIYIVIAAAVIAVAVIAIVIIKKKKS